MEIFLVLAGLFMVYVVLVTIVGVGIWAVGLIIMILLGVLSPFIRISVVLFMRAFEMIEVLISFLKHLLYLASVGQFLEGYSKLKDQIEEDYLIETGQITRRSRE